ncbi:MAG: hypothetical protein M3362_00320 [Acidobacteriota bacterium]|nr:hypothetical protein [Acidobacteriota bacterium]
MASPIKKKKQDLDELIKTSLVGKTPTAPPRTTPINQVIQVVHANPTQTVVPARTTPISQVITMAAPKQQPDLKVVDANGNKPTISANNVGKFTRTSTADLITNGDTNPLTAPIRKTLGFVLGGLDPLIKDISNIHIQNYLADKVSRGELHPDVLDANEVINKSNAQIVGDVGQTVLTAYTPNIATGLLSEGFGKEATVQVIKELAKQGAIEGGTAGLQFGLAQALSSGTKDPKEFAKIVAQNAAIGAGLGVATSAVLPAAKGVAEHHRNIIDNLAESPEAGFMRFNPKADELGNKINELNKQWVERPTPANKKALDSATAEYKKLAAEGGYIANPLGKLPSKQELLGKVEDVQTQLFDRLAPIRNLTKGKNIAANADPYVAARLYAGHYGKIQSRLDDLSDILRPGKADLPLATEYAKLERSIEKAGQGVTKFEGGKTLGEIKARKAQIDASPDAVRIRTLADEIRGYTDQNLKELRDAGIISKKAYEDIKAKNQKYIPFDRVEYLAEHADDIPRGSQSFSVNSQNVIKQMTGSEKEIANPIESLVRQTYSTVSLVERNKVFNQVRDLARRDDFKDTIIPLKSGEEVPKGMEKVSGFVDGVKQEVAVPKAVGEALKGLNKEATDIITKWASLSSKTLRAGATSLNVAFLPANAIRDFQTATVVSKVGFTPLDWLKGFTEAIKRGDDYKAFLESGGSFSGFFEGNKSLPSTAKKLTEGTGTKVLKTVANPIELLRTVGETVELAPRLGVFKRSLRKGLSSSEAAYNARNATVDFSKSGTAMEVANKWVPFLNARLQGTTNLFSAIKDRPVSSALKLGAIVGAPIVATYFHNTRKYGDIWNDIQQYEKDNNFIIIYGDNVDADGNPTQVVKIPKGPAQIFGNPLEEFLTFLDHKDPKSLSTIALQFFSNSSPVSFERNGELSGQAALGGVLPPTAKAGIETATNTNLYTGNKIVPDYIDGVQSKTLSPKEQYTSRTSRFAKWLGNKVNFSPAKIDNLIGTQFGGVGRQVTNPQTFGSQVSGRFVGARGGQQEKETADNAERFAQEQADAKVNLNRQAKEKLQELQQSSDPALDFDDIARSQPDLARAIIREKEKQDKGFTYKDNIIESLQVQNGQRAKFIADELNRLDTNEQKAAFWDDLVNKGLITEKVADQLTKLIK